MTSGGLPRDDRAPGERRAALDPTLADLLDTLAGAVADGYLDDAPELRATTLAQLAAWGFDVVVCARCGAVLGPHEERYCLACAAQLGGAQPGEADDDATG